MQTNDLSDQTPTAEDLSERSESSRSSVSSSSNPSDSSFQPYKCLQELAAKPEEDASTVAHRYLDYSDVPIALDKPKDYAIQKSEGYNQPTAVNSYRNVNSLSGSQKDAMYSFYREIRQKALQRSATIGVPEKELEIIKSYGLPIDRMKDFNELTSRIALERLRSNVLHGDNPTSLEPEDLKQSFQQIQSRVHQGQMDPGITLERLRQGHPLFQVTETSQTGQFSHSLQHNHAFTQLQHQQVQQHQPLNHQHQPKSFTIDAILGLRSSSQREKHQRHHSYKKHLGESSVKVLTGSCQDGNNSNSSASGGKLKRVRTIFTAEQLERLEGEFSRQQYMVGPERLYLAHALRLTEAQVKVWFQNRRIKWRKVNHEQASQRLHELHQSGVTAVEPEDSNENSPEW